MTHAVQHADGPGAVRASHDTHKADSRQDDRRAERHRTERHSSERHADERAEGKGGNVDAYA